MQVKLKVHNYLLFYFNYFLDIERLRILCQQVEGTASGVSVAGKQEDASQEDSAIEKHFEKSTNLIEHVQLVEVSSK